MWSKGTQSLLVETHNGTATLEDDSAFSYETKHAPTISSSNCAPCNLIKGIEVLCPHKNPNTDVCSSFIYNCPKFGSNQDVLQ
jgi:hypothetical protein